jgi:zinc transport system substrate-binding protein
MRAATRVIPALFALFINVSCGERASRPPRPVVVATVLPLGHFVRKVAGDLVSVEVLIPPGASPATYEPTIRQMAALQDASLLVKVGHPHFPFERAWLDRLLEDRRDLKVVSGAQGLPLSGEDPHVWVSPANVRKMTESIARALVEMLPEHREDVETRRDAFLEEIATLDRELRSSLGPYRGRKFLVFHPAWGHFAEAYGIRQISIEHEEKEPGPKELAHLVELARQESVRVVFIQPQFNRASAELVAGEIGARVVVVDPLAPDWADNLRNVAHAFREAFDK